MATKSVAQKLLIKPGQAVWVSDEDMARLIEPLPEGAALDEELATSTVAVLVVHDAATAETALDTHRHELAAPTVLWIAYPKGNVTDINRDSLWPMAAEYGLRPVTQVAIDGTWSALRFRPLKDGEAPFTGGRQVR